MPRLILIYQGPSMSWVPSVHEIYRGVSRIIRPGGRYRVDFGNPANHFWEWDGEYYRITEPYSRARFLGIQKTAHSTFGTIWVIYSTDLWTTVSELSVLRNGLGPSQILRRHREVGRMKWLTM